MIAAGLFLLFIRVTFRKQTSAKIEKKLLEFLKMHWPDYAAQKRLDL
jgi:hypothetical protein